MNDIEAINAGLAEACGCRSEKVHRNNHRNEDVYFNWHYSGDGSILSLFLIEYTKNGVMRFLNYDKKYCFMELELCDPELVENVINTTAKVINRRVRTRKEWLDSVRYGKRNGYY